MAWEDELFAYLDDLEGQAAALYDAERAPDLLDRSRTAYQEVTLSSRLVASTDLELTLELVGVGAVTGRLTRVGDGWSLLRGPGQEWVVPHHAVAAAHGVSDRSVPEVAWPALTRLSLTAALARLADGAEPCALHLTDGRRHDGTLLRVGADFVELAAGAAARVVLVATAHLAAVQSRPGAAA
ncbi:hypothetical protein G5V58_15625 [Nocardioides anomalus]|uniref:Uncharacterized protein n=1 Tax=Nocardioides anomalus TaxID=2712223 RepID=A0A6G6WFZ9_9ACTN|nr:hypothetical protein [Nocardioides anomalus]QIG44015.1 hypothetical protein G5V58_15625 [Nocardioides anomalus]